MLRKIFFLILPLIANVFAQNEFGNAALYYEVSSYGMTWIEAVQVGILLI